MRDNGGPNNFSEEKMMANRRNVQATQDIDLPEGFTKDHLLFPFCKCCMSAANAMSCYDKLSHLSTQLSDLAEDAVRPISLVVMGQFKTGKSTFINALLGEDVLVSDVTPATAAVTLLRYGDRPTLRVHYQGGEERKLPIGDLGVISAESDRRGEQLRQGLKYVEVQLPNKLLKEFNIVDTPGINSDNDLHTAATREFTSRADAVLWLFSYSQAGTRIEASELQNLPEGCVPLAVINQIDQHDPEEEDIQSILKRVENRLGSQVKGLVAVSARNAISARLQGSLELLRECGWESLWQTINTNVVAKSPQHKSLRLIYRLSEIADNLHQIVTADDTSYKIAMTTLTDARGFEKSLRDEMQTLQSVANRWSIGLRQDIFEHIMGYPDIPQSVLKADSFRRQLAIYRSAIAEIYREISQVREDSKKLQSRIANHNHELMRHNEEFEKWRHSGIFGGQPFIDLNHDGPRLQAESERLNNLGANLNVQNETQNALQNALNQRIWRMQQELIEFRIDVYSAISQSILEMEQTIRHRDNAIMEAENESEKYDWTVNFSKQHKKLLVQDLTGGISCLNANGANLTSQVDALASQMKGLFGSDYQKPHLQPVSVEGNT
jgi:predicted GTPase